MKFNLPVI